MENLKVETYLPGAPEIIFDTEYEEKNEIYDYNQEHGTDLEYDAFDWDYETYEDEVALVATNFVRNHLKEVKIFKTKDTLFSFVESITCQGVTSKNGIDVKIELTPENIKNILTFLNKNKSLFAEYLKSNYKSYDGFMSFYSYDIADWINEEALSHHHKLGSILTFILFTIFGRNDFEMQCYEEVRENCYLIYTLLETVNKF